MGICGRCTLIFIQKIVISTCLEMLAEKHIYDPAINFPPRPQTRVMHFGKAFSNSQSEVSDSGAGCIDAIFQRGHIVCISAAMKKGEGVVP